MIKEIVFLKRHERQDKTTDVRSKTLKKYRTQKRKVKKDVENKFQKQNRPPGVNLFNTQQIVSTEM